MAEFCPECARKVFGVDKRDEDFILSEDLCFCEECCEWKKVVIGERKNYIEFKIPLWLKRIFKK